MNFKEVMQMKKHLFLALAFAAVLAGCSSVPLEQAPVEDRRAATIDPNAGRAPAQSQVAPVTADPTQANTIGPSGVPRLVYFDYDSYVIKPEFQGLIESHARFLKSNTGRRIVIEGHTDERGGREYNLALGQRRSEAVRRALNLLGVGDSQMEAVSFGEEKPAAAGGDETAWAQNRRAEIAYR
jgi:peptidoglycan-associated lipoprotein